MKRVAVWIVVAAVAAFTGVGCQTTKKCCGKCQKGAAVENACGSCKKDGAASKTETAKCAKCSMDKTACKCAAAATK